MLHQDPNLIRTQLNRFLQEYAESSQEDQNLSDIELLQKAIKLLPNREHKLILLYVCQIDTSVSTLSSAILGLTLQKNNQNHINQANQLADILRSFLLNKMSEIPIQNEEERNRLYQALQLLARFFPSSSQIRFNSVVCPITQAPLDVANSSSIFVSGNGTWYSFPDLLEYLNGNRPLVNSATIPPFLLEDWYRIQILQKEQYNVYLYTFFLAGTSSGFIALIMGSIAFASAMTTMAILANCIGPFILTLSVMSFVAENFKDREIGDYFLNVFNCLLGITALITLSLLLPYLGWAIFTILPVTFNAGLVGGLAGSFLSILCRPLLNALSYPKNEIISKKEESALNTLMPVALGQPPTSPSFGSKVIAAWQRCNLFSSCTHPPLPPAQIDRALAHMRPSA